MTKTSIKDIEEMILKSVTVLIPKSQIDEFKNLTEGFQEFTLCSYEKSERFQHKSLSINLTSTQLKK